jgi:N-acetylglucosamine kinase-like BadF-type ATPase
MADTVDYGVVSGEPLNPHSRDPATFEANYRALIASVVVEVGGELRSEPNIVVSSIEGTYGTPEQELIRSAVSSSAAACNTVLFVDRAHASILANEDPNEVLVLLHAGRIAFCAALWPRVDPRKLFRIGGYGPFSIDDGGGYTLGRRVLLRLLEDLDAGHDSTASAQVRRFVGWSDPYDPLRWIRRAGDGFSLLRDVADLGSLVVRLAEEQVPGFEPILEESAQLLASNALHLIGLLNASASELTFGFTGSIALRSSNYRQSALARMTASLDESLRCRELRRGVLDGCLALGFRKLGIAPRESRRIIDSIHRYPASLA